MPIVALLLIASVLFAPTAARAADGREIFGTILQGIAGEIDRQQQRKAAKRAEQRFNELRPSCEAGEVAACDAMLAIPNLKPEVWNAISNHRQRLQHQQQAAFNAFQNNWAACGRFESIEVCDAALWFPGISIEDSSKLVQWREQTRLRIKIAAERAERERNKQREAAEIAAREREKVRKAAASVSSAQPAQSAQSVRSDPISAVSTRRDRTIDRNEHFVALGVVLIGGLLYLVIRLFRQRDPIPMSSIAAGGVVQTGEAHPELVTPTVNNQNDALPALTGHFPTDIRNALLSS